MKRITDYAGNVGPGWFDLLTELDAELSLIRPDYELLQVKEKFGGLRVYIDNCSKITSDIISKYENRSYKICEDCGNPGKLNKKGYWLRTICEKCAAGTEYKKC